MHILKCSGLVWLLLATVMAQAQKTGSDKPAKPGLPTVTRPGSTGSSNLAVVVNNQIQVEMLVPTVTVAYNKRRDTKTGVTLTAPNQFTITSNRPYGIAVASSSDFLFNRIYQLPVNAISINILKAANTGSAKTITLSSKLQSITSKAPATINQPFSITYKVNPLSVLQTLPTGIYTATLTYTATQE